MSELPESSGIHLVVVKWDFFAIFKHCKENPKNFTFFVQIVFHCFGKLPNGGECVADFSDFRRHGLNNRGMTLWRWKVDRSSFAHWGSRQEKDKQTNADPSDPGQLTLIHCFLKSQNRISWLRWWLLILRLLMLLLIFQLKSRTV